MARRLLIAGCGDLGARLYARLGDDWSVTGLRRNVGKLPSGMGALSADLLDPGTLDGLARDWDAVIYTATPGAFDEAAYRATYCTGLAHLLERVRTPRLLFVSSTAVYGQDRGEWVDEDSVTEPERFNGRVLLDGERIALDADGLVVRFSGLYGPGRDALVRKLRAGGVDCRRTPPQWTNRIHADDAVAALAHLLTLDAERRIWVASDERPAPKFEVLAWLTRRLGVPAPEAIDEGGATADESAGQGKRVSSARLRATGLRLQYPDYERGYEALLT
ncbi:SDR family oxidoreductase [Halomonas denitrificans]|nr:SDR family oxidoreductase [Halomonas denitrificans]